MSRSRLAPVALLALLALLAPLTATVGPAGAGAAQQPGNADPRRSERAVNALAKVEDLLAGHGRGSDLTLALRDLAVLRTALPAAQQRRAASYLSRPTDKPRRCSDISCYRTEKVRRVCSPVVCVHYVRRKDDRFNGVAAADRDRDGRPNYVEKVLANVTRVHRTYVRAGYRAPLRDGRRGGNGKRDIYLAQIGDRGYYGYCTTDDRRVPRHGAASAYCVLDNDYRKREFPRHTPIQNMQVTAAHEYFHAVQFGYDIGEDRWFMEGTATWAEDEVYDRINDNYAYLRSGPIGRPHIPLNTFESRGLYQYGTWIFFRSVSERFPAGRLPRVVREMWEYADARGRSAPDLASLAAIQAALADRSTGLATRFTQMAYENRTPARYYAEGERYPRAPLRGEETLAAGQPWTRTFDQDHLTSTTYRVRPGTGASELLLMLTSEDAAAARAVAQVFRTDGTVRTRHLEPEAGGTLARTVEFSAATVKWVELTVVNTSRRANDVTQVVTFEALPSSP